MRRIISSLFLCSLVACGPVSGDNGGTNNDGGGTCLSGETRCSINTFQVCVDGQFVDQTVCPASCHDALGCVECNPDLGNVCVGDEIHSCAANGSIGALVDTCLPGACSSGHCADPCSAAAAARSYIGCEYWPVDLHNAIEVLSAPFFPGQCLQGEPEVLDVCYHQGNGQTAGQCDWDQDCSAAGAGYVCTNMEACVINAEYSPFAIVISNPHDGVVNVTISNSTGMTQTVNVAANSVESIFPQDMGFPDQSIPHGGISSTGAYKITSDRPVVAYQFNPLDNVGVFSNDGSLLLPEHTYDTKYYVVTAPTLTRRPQTNDYNGYFTVVASAEGTTNIDVTPSCNTRPGPSVPAISAGTTESFALEQWDTLTIESVADGDLTGTLVQNTTDDKTFGVFVGHQATVIYSGAQVCCADHLEDQLFPASTWGMIYAIARSQQRASEPDRLRIIAQDEDAATVVTFNPSPTILEGDCANLAAGEFCVVDISSDTEVTASGPIMVGHLLHSTGGDAGDPALAFAVPTEQFRSEYDLLVPSEYAENYFAIVAPAEGTVVLDGIDVTSSLSTFGSGTYKGGRISVTAGPHSLTCSEGCGVEVMGYDEAVSYLFAGGLDLERIVVN